MVMKERIILLGSKNRVSTGMTDCGCKKCFPFQISKWNNNKTQELPVAEFFLSLY
jgi:hypothetical protein